ncbi:coatomer subunit [Plasmopara halstedii]|uniref:Coatomer subunit beta n=1 Tax=Plasmopara halstedii TaxID=4781 RepID=A0A0P1A6C3_PLAHL|nr:coatomer subunit [Plasmopara halstedii]CEG36146.1 coatomer subunit [Plasmopara halstedii]|eukprot:XP_024572515.1 coatomer subunit [Plasmopara halstedii]
MAGVTNERYCTVLLQQVTNEKAIPPSQDEILKGLESPKVELKIQAVKSAILALLQGEKLPKVLMHIIRFCSTQSDHTLKKLLMVFWEIAPKYEQSGTGDKIAPKLLPEMILVCNALLNDLNHPNEYIRGCMLRFLCRIKEKEILEPLKDAVKSNLEHRHSYVRKNAVMTVYTMYKTYGDMLIPDAPELIERFILCETDAGARRNAFLMLNECAQDRAMTFLMNAMDQVPKFGDGFSLVILEMTRKVCRQDPAQKARFVRCVFQLLNSSSPAVSYEAAWTLVTLSAAPTAVRAAAKTYSGLLNSQSDNNVKLIVLDRLADLKKYHTKVLQEILMDIMRALSSPNLDICRKVLDIAMDLVSVRNIDEVVTHLKREVVKTQDKTREKAGEYRHLLIKAIHACAVKFPEVANAVVHLLMEFLNQPDGAMDVILFVRAMCESYPDLRESILQKLMISFSEISRAKVYRVALWILSEYATLPPEDGTESDTSIFEAANTIFTVIGSLPLATEAMLKTPTEDTEGPEIAAGTGAAYSKPVTKSIVLADGTYATETSYSGPAAKSAIAEDENVPGLRRLLLNGDFFLGAAVASTLTKLCLRLSNGDLASATARDVAIKKLVVTSTRYMCAIVAFGQAKTSKHEIDQDSARRILMCVRVLLDPASAQAMHTIITEECRDAYRRLLDTQKMQESEAARAAGGDSEPLTQVDELINFRQLRGKKALGSTDIDIDDGADINRALGQQGDDSNEYAGAMRHVHQLTGFADPVYAEAYVTVHDYDILLEILVVNRIPQTLTNLTVDLSTIGDLKLVERPQPQTIGPLDQRTIRANIKVSSTETGHIFGNIVYDSASGAEKTYVNLNDIHMDIMDYIKPATCTDSAFRSMWAEFEWENKVAVNTDLSNVFEFLQHVVDKTNMRCMTPTASLGGDTNFLAANLYAKSVFGEDALVNLSVEKQDNGRIAGYIRIRSKTQGIALSLGDRITAVQRGKDDQSKRKKLLV